MPTADVVQLSKLQALEKDLIQRERDTELLRRNLDFKGVEATLLRLAAAVN